MEKPINPTGRTLKHLLNEEQRPHNCTLFAEITMEPGSVIDYHEHHGENETYYILSGQGSYNDNGTIRPVTAGDVTFTPDHHGHGLENTGETELTFIALILPN